MRDFEQLWAMQPTAFVAFFQQESLPDVRLSVLTNAAPESKPLYECVDGVAIIPVEGVISRHAWYGASLHDTQDALIMALADPTVRAVLLSVYSPGGSACGVKELSDAIFAARSVKPCAAWVDGLCASAAYWLASATGTIYAGPSSTVGSIGVVLRHLDQSGLNSQRGLSYTYVAAGSYKAVGNPDSTLSDRDKDVLQNRVNALYDIFCSDVSQHMGLAPEKSELWADGKDFLGTEALSLGLVTALVSSRAEAIQRLLKEHSMNKEELEKQHPELLASIQAEAVEAAMKAVSKEQMTAGSVAAQQQETQAAQATVLALLETVYGTETAEKVRNLINAHISPEQLKAAAQVFMPTAPSSQNLSAQADSSFKMEMLTAIKSATPDAVGTALGNHPVTQDDASAMIDRIGSM